MGVLDRFLDAMHMNPDDDDYDDDYDDYDYYDDDEDDDEDDEPSAWQIKRQQAKEAKAKKKEEKAKKKEEAAREKEAMRSRQSQRDRQMGLDDDEDDYEDERPARAASFSRTEKAQPERFSSPSRPQPQSKITPISKAPRKTGFSNMEVCVIRPTGIQDEIEICDTLLDGRTVILNMEGFDLAMAQRIIDFVSGAIYAMNGNLQKVSKYIFLATPRGVDISGDISEIVEQYDDNSSNYSF